MILALVIEEKDDVNLKNIAETLNNKFGIEVMKCFSKEGAFNIIERFHFDLIVISYWHSTGSLLKLVDTTREWWNPPPMFVLITEYPNHREIAHQNRIWYSLQEPINIKEFSEIVEKIKEKNI